MQILVLLQYTGGKNNTVILTIASLPGEGVACWRTADPSQCLNGAERGTARHRGARAHVRVCLNQWTRTRAPLAHQQPEWQCADGLESEHQGQVAQRCSVRRRSTRAHHRGYTTAALPRYHGLNTVKIGCCGFYFLMAALKSRWSARQREYSAHSFFLPGLVANADKSALLLLFFLLPAVA